MRRRNTAGRGAAAAALLVALSGIPMISGCAGGRTTAKESLADRFVVNADEDQATAELDFFDALAQARAVTNHDALRALMLTFSIDDGIMKQKEPVQKPEPETDSERGQEPGSADESQADSSAEDTSRTAQAPPAREHQSVSSSGEPARMDHDDAPAIHDDSVYQARLKVAHRRGWIPTDDNPPANETAQVGWIANAICIEAGIRGGVTMRLFGPSARYSLRELVSMQMLPGMSEKQAITGLQLVGLLSRVQDEMSGHTDKARQEF